MTQEPPPSRDEVRAARVLVAQAACALAQGDARRADELLRSFMGATTRWAL